MSDLLSPESDIMESGKSGSDPLEQVRKLEEKVKALEYQLSQQSSQSRNGAQADNHSSGTCESGADCDILPLGKLVNLSNCKLWLEESCLEEDSGASEEGMIAALRAQGLRGAPRSLYDELCHAEQVEQDRRRAIDSRTFTRPKKRIGRPNLELFESLARTSSAGEPVLPRAADMAEAELDNMTCSLLNSSIINSLSMIESSPENESQSQISFINKKQKVMPSMHEEKLLTSDGGVDNSSNIYGPATFKIGVRTSTVEAMEISPPDWETADNSLGIMDSQILNVGLMDSINLNLMSSDSKSMNVTFTPPEDCCLSSLKNNLQFVNSSCEDQCLNQTFQKNAIETFPVKQLNVTYTPSPPLNSTFMSSNDIEKPLLNITFTPPSHEPTVTKQPSLSKSFVSSSNGKEALNSTFTPSSNSCFEKAPLNTTYLPRNGNSALRIISSLPRAASTDSGGVDDDQLSSTSDSSHTSATRLMNLGDVQNIARLQEQSLVMSTPKQSVQRAEMEDLDTVSPILSRPCSEPDVNTVGYGSDRSHSSRSPLSSLQSSPANSPFGSSTALPTAQSHPHPDQITAARPNGVLQRRDTYSMIPPMKSKVMGLRPPAPLNSAGIQAQVAAPLRPPVRSGLRPPMVRTAVSNISKTTATGLTRLTGTGIPRPPQASSTRIPPPKIRASSVTRKKEWTDECY